MWLVNKMCVEIMLLFSPKDFLSVPYIGKWRFYWAILSSGKFNLVTSLSEFPLNISTVKMNWSFGSRHKKKTLFDHSLCYCKRVWSNYWRMPKLTSLPSISACVADVLIPEPLDLFKIAVETRGWYFSYQIHLATVWILYFQFILGYPGDCLKCGCSYLCFQALCCK